MMCIQRWHVVSARPAAAALLLGAVMSVSGSRPCPQSSEPVQVPQWALPAWRAACQPGVPPACSLSGGWISSSRAEPGLSPAGRALETSVD